MVQLLKKEKEELTKKKNRNTKQKTIKVTDKQNFKIIEGMTEAKDHYHNQYIETTEKIKKKQADDVLINTIKNSGILIGVYICVLIAYLILGYNTSCMITRYYHYFKMEMNDNEKDKGFLGINQTLKKGIIEDPDGIYCEAEKPVDVKTEEQGGEKSKPETINSAGITKKNVIHTYVLYSGDEEGKCLDASEDNIGIIGTSKKVSIMNFVFLRKMFYSFIKTFIILEQEKQEEVQTGGSDVSEPRKIAGFKAPIEQEIRKDPNKILYHKANSLSVIAPIVLVIGILLMPIFIFFYSIYNTLFNSNGYTFRGTLGGLISTLLDPFVIMAYGLAFMLLFGSDTFAANYLRTDLKLPPGAEQPNFLGYLFSVKTVFMVIVWLISLLIHLGLTNFKNPITLSIYMGLGFFIILYSFLSKVMNYDIYNILGKTFDNKN